jgi:transposase
MIIVGVDFHPSVQQVAFLDTETGETGERRLNHSDGEAERSIAIYSEDRSRCVLE